MSDIQAPFCSQSVDGELTIYTAAQWHQTLMGVCAGNCDLTLDLGEVTEIDAAGVQLLIALQRQWAADGRQLAVTRLSRPVRDALAFCCLEGCFAERRTQAPLENGVSP